MRVYVDIDMAKLQRNLSDLERKQFPFAAALALNDVGRDVLAAIEDETDRAFDRPTRWTRKAFYMMRASKRNLAVKIERKTAQRGRHFLEVQEAGGVRPQTGLEKLLTSRLKYAGVIRTVTPAKGARLNAYGNWSPGQRNQVLSAVKAQRDRTANTTKASKARNKRRSDYFVPRDGSRLSPGVYERKSSGSIRKVLHFSDGSARYRKRFRFYEASHKEAFARFPMHLARRLVQALATAK